MKALSMIPCPRLDQLTESQLNQAAKTFDELAKHTLLPPCQAHVDPVRKKIDLAVLNMLELDHQEAINMLRWLWCNEPSVHGQNRKALSLLQHTEN